jgi:2-oxoisovalerate ferredoxin oxidoreductase alpha subunit
MVLDPDKPIVHGNLLMPNQEYMEFRFKIHDSMQNAIPVIKDVIRDFAENFGRDYTGLIEPYRCKDAEFVVITVGALAEQIKDAVDNLRKKGIKAGSLKLRYFRPFPVDDLIELIENHKNIKGIAVVDRSIAYGSPCGGHIGTEFNHVLQKVTRKMTYVPCVWGLGGRDVTIEDQESVFTDLMNLCDGKEIKSNVNKIIHGTLWVNLK